MNRAGARVLGIVALVLTATTFVAAIHDVSTTWDVWYYHLPFAARIWHIVPADLYVLSSTNAERFRGFPLLGEFLQGLFWRVTGRPESANLVAFGSVAVYAVVLRRWFDVPLWLTAIGLMAIPLVHTHATSCYVDLPANVGASVLILGAYRIVALGDEPTAPLLVAMGVGAAVAANMRLQLCPIVALVVAVVGLRFVASCFGHDPSRRRVARWRVVVSAAAALFVFATPVKNALLYRNPAYPIALTVAGHELPHAEGAYSYAPPHIAGRPKPIRFLVSVLEIGARPWSDTRRWTVDEWAPSDSTASRLGGSFGAYVVAELALLAYFAVRDRTRHARAALAGFGALTAATTFMPQSHELRYYLYWEIVLVSLVCILAVRRGASASVRIGPVGAGAIAALALAVVIGVTRGTYVMPFGRSFSTLLRDEVDPRALEAIHDDERVCLMRWPWTLLYASSFHPGHRWVIHEVESREACGEARWID